MAEYTLYEIGDELTQLEEFLLDIDGDLSEPEVESLVDHWLADSKDKLETKLEGYGHVIKNNEVRASAKTARLKAVKEEVKRLQLGVSRHTSLVDKFKKRLQLFIDAHGIEEVETETFRFRPVNNGGALPVEIDDYLKENAEELPERFRKVTFTPDLVEIRKALEDGEEIEGARLADRGRRLNIA